MSYLNEQYVITLIEKTYYFGELDDEVMENIEEPNSDRPNPYIIEKDIELTDDNGLSITCTAVFEVLWVYYNSSYKHGSREEIPADNWFIHADDVVLDDYKVVEVYDIKADI